MDSRSVIFLSCLLSGIIYGITTRNFRLKLRNSQNVPVYKIINTISNEFEILMPSQSIKNNKTNDLFDEVKILCWIMTQPQNIKSRSLHIKKLWGKKCNKILFFSSQDDVDLPAIGLPVGEGRESLWGKTQKAFKYVYDYHRNDADWFMKADDDTYVVMENLRHFLKPYNASDPIYFGCKFKALVKKGFMSGGAGYILSKEAMDRFVTKGLNSTNREFCRHAVGGNEDVEIGTCLQNVFVQAGDSRDSLNRGRFFPFIPSELVKPGPISRSYWYFQYVFYPTETGLPCCSDTAISFHYMHIKHMYAAEYLLYHVRPLNYLYHKFNQTEEWFRVEENRKNMMEMNGNKSKFITNSNEEKLNISESPFKIDPIR